MAIEGTEQVVEQPGGGSTTTETQKPEQKSGTQETKQPAAGAQPDKLGEYEKQIAGFKADLIKERKARQQYESDLKTERANLEAERKRTRALVGVETPTEQQAEDEAIKQRLKALGYPMLSKEDLDAIREIRSNASALQQTTTHYWESHGERMVEAVGEEIAKELGGALNERQKKSIALLYGQEAESNPEFLQRHSRGDKTLAAEFAKQIIEDWFEPARRKITQQEVQRQRPVPFGKDRGIVTQGDKKIDVNDSKALEDMLVKGFKERGGQFGRK